MGRKNFWSKKWSGQFRSALIRIDQERVGKFRTEQERTGQERSGQRSGEVRTGQGKSGEVRTGQDWSGQDKEGQDRTGQVMPGQSRSEKFSHQHNSKKRNLTQLGFDLTKVKFVGLSVSRIQEYRESTDNCGKGK